jgi:hypothetical protein
MATVRRGWISLLVATLGSLILVPAAHAAFGFQGLSAAPTNTNAGANSNFNVHIGFTQATDDVKDLTISLPPGMVGNPTVTPLCTMTQLQGDSCPSASQVGTVTANATAHLLDPLPLNLPLTVNGSLYNVTAAAGQPARFGIVLRPIGSDPLPVFQKIVQVSEVRLRKSDFGLDTVLANVPRTAQALSGALSVPTDINSMDISLSGVVGGKGFMRNPTSCGTKTTKFTATSYANPNQPVTGQASWVSTNCAALPFSPNLLVGLGGPGATAAGKTIPMTTTITQANGEAGLRNATALLPTQVGPNITVLDHQCPLNRFRTDATTCPPATKVGTATASSPFLPSALNGTVVITTPPPGEFLPGLGVDLRGPLALQVIGSFVLTPALGNAFSDLPDIPISNFKLRFKGGNGGLISTGVNLCKARPPLFRGAFEGWNAANKNVAVRAKINGCPS